MTEDYEGGARDKLFSGDIIKSYKAVYHMANWWDQRQVPVQVPVLSSIPVTPLSDKVTVSDGGKDLLVGHKRGKVEIKHRWDMTFQSVDEFPFDTINVDVKHKIDNFGPAFLYVFLNGDLSCALFLRPSRTRDYWAEDRRHDRRIGRVRNYYLCKKRHLNSLPIKIEKTTIIPLWSVSANGNEDSERAAHYKRRIVAHSTFDGHNIAPIVHKAQAEGFHVALRPLRIGHWNDRGHWEPTR